MTSLSPFSAGRSPRAGSDTTFQGHLAAELTTRRPEVRAAAATALGLVSSKEAIPELRTALSERKPAVALAAAHALQRLNDRAGYEAYYEVLTGERKSAEGLVGQQLETLEDRKRIAELSTHRICFVERPASQRN